MRWSRSSRRAARGGSDCWSTGPRLPGARSSAAARTRTRPAGPRRSSARTAPSCRSRPASATGSSLNTTGYSGAGTPVWNHDKFPPAQGHRRRDGLPLRAGPRPDADRPGQAQRARRPVGGDRQHAGGDPRRGAGEVRVARREAAQLPRARRGSAPPLPGPSGGQGLSAPSCPARSGRRRRSRRSTTASSTGSRSRWGRARRSLKSSAPASRTWRNVLGRSRRR
jgi:hypothetical protein